MWTEFQSSFKLFAKVKLLTLSKYNWIINPFVKKEFYLIHEKVYAKI